MSTKTIKLTDEQGDAMLPESCESGEGYIKFSDGSLICYGLTLNANYTSWPAVFAKAFVDTNYTAFGMPNGIFSNAHVLSIDAISTNRMNVYTDKANVLYAWLAIGRWK